MIACHYFLVAFVRGSKEVYWVKARVGKVPDVFDGEIIDEICTSFCRHNDSAFLIDAGVIFKQEVYELTNLRSLLRSCLFT